MPNQSGYYDSSDFLNPEYPEDQQRRVNQIIKNAVNNITKLYAQAIKRINNYSTMEIQEVTKTRIGNEIETSKLGGRILNDYKDFVRMRISEVFEQAYGKNYNQKTVMDSLVFKITKVGQELYPDFTWNNNMLNESIKITEYNKRQFNKNFYGQDRLQSQMNILAYYDSEMDVIGQLDGEEDDLQDMYLEDYKQESSLLNNSSLFDKTIIEPSKLLAGIKGDASNWYAANQNRYYSIIDKQIKKYK